MSDRLINQAEEPVVTYSNVEYYDSFFDQESGTGYMAHIQEIKDSDLVIEDNTVYEIDPDCYKHLARKRARNQNR